MPNSTASYLQVLEEHLLDIQTRRNSSDIQRVLADNFIEFTASGNVVDTAQVLSLLESEPPIIRVLRDFSVNFLAPEIALVTYRMTQEDEYGYKKESLRSSVWKRIDNNWRMVFHQGTPVNPDI